MERERRRRTGQLYTRHMRCPECERKTKWLRKSVSRPTEPDSVMFGRCDGCHAVHIYWKSRGANMYFRGECATKLSKILVNRTAVVRTAFFDLLELALKDAGKSSSVSISF